MARRRKSSPDRIRVGKVSLYLHHGSWYAYYRESGRPIRVRLTTDQAEALAAAEEIDRNLSLFRPSPFGQRAISLEELRREFLADHEHVRRHSLATLNRCRATPLHVQNFAAENRRREKPAEFSMEEFVCYRARPAKHRESECLLCTLAIRLRRSWTWIDECPPRHSGKLFSCEGFGPLVPLRSYGSGGST